MSTPYACHAITADHAAPSLMVYAVTTTGIFCRPGCPSRRPKPEHVQWFRDAAQAKEAGFRACKRCRPDTVQPGADPLIVALAAILDQDEPTPSLAALAARFQLSERVLRARFQAATGLTPKAYARAAKIAKADAALAQGAAVTEAIYAAGFSGPSRFYDARPSAIAPSAARHGAPGEIIPYAIAPCAFGQAAIAVTERGVCAVLLGDDDAELLAGLRARFSRATLVPAEGAPAERIREALAALTEPAAARSLPLDIRGTAFEARVWAALRAIPFGTTTSYSALAASMGAPQSTRAVARACAKNPIAVLIPCHRVVGKSGSLTGYAWGLRRKQALLEAEAKAAASPEESE